MSLDVVVSLAEVVRVGLPPGQAWKAPQEPALADSKQTGPKVPFPQSIPALGMDSAGLSLPGMWLATSVRMTAVPALPMLVMLARVLTWARSSPKYADVTSVPQAARRGLMALFLEMTQVELAVTAEARRLVGTAGRASK